MRIGFASSSWTGLWILLFPPASSTSASPTRTSFGLRWTSPRRQPGRWFISKTPRCSSRSRKVWGFEAFCTRITGPRARNWLRSDCRMTKESSMKPANPRILTINGGSSSIKFALYQVEEPLKRGLYGKVDRIGLSAVIRGDTPHFDYVAAEAAKGIAHVAAETGVPVAFGVLTTNTLEQAIDRAGAKGGNKGFDAAMTAIEMANLLRTLRQAT